jgi:hypothetical protein
VPPVFVKRSSQRDCMVRIFTKNRVKKQAFLIRITSLIAATIIIPTISPFGILSAEPKKMEGVAPGDCGVCHGSEKVLPVVHIDTKGMAGATCKECHKGGASLRGKMPLSHSHQLKGVTCADCHGMTRPAKPSEQKKCLSCHADYKKAAILTDKTLPPPHDSHMGDLDCGLCHHQHSKSENFCFQCHEWKYLVP